MDKLALEREKLLELKWTALSKNGKCKLTNGPTSEQK